MQIPFPRRSQQGRSELDLESNIGTKTVSYLKA